MDPLSSPPRVPRGRDGLPRWAFAVGAGASVLAIGAFVPLGFLLTPFAGMFAVVFTAAHRSDPPAALHTRVLLGLTFGSSGLALVLVSILHILVWNPSAKVPGLTLDEIYAEMAAAGELPAAGHVILVLWATVWTIAAVVFMIGSRLPWLSARRIVVIGCAMLGLIATTQWMASFNMGMGLADTFMTSGADATPFGPVLMVAGQIAIATAVALALPRGRRLLAA